MVRGVSASLHMSHRLRAPRWTRRRGAPPLQERLHTAPYSTRAGGASFRLRPDSEEVGTDLKQERRMPQVARELRARAEHRLPLTWTCPRPEVEGHLRWQEFVSCIGRSGRRPVAGLWRNKPASPCGQGCDGCATGTERRLRADLGGPRIVRRVGGGTKTAAVVANDAVQCPARGVACRHSRGWRGVGRACLVANPARAATPRGGLDSRKGEQV
jgi:hypothetical protein